MIETIDWGLIEYKQAWDKQKALVEEVQKNRNDGFLVFCEHPSVITIGKSGTINNVLKTKEFLQANGIALYENDRGGDVTLHNPGQLVVYPIINLSNFKEDLHWFLRKIEEAIIQLIKLYGIIGSRISNLTGVWIEDSRKIAAIGMHCSRWVTSHGLALNVNNDISEFDFIIPCGITEKTVCSMKSELNKNISIDELKVKFNDIFQQIMSDLS